MSANYYCTSWWKYICDEAIDSRQHISVLYPVDYILVKAVWKDELNSGCVRNAEWRLETQYGLYNS